MGCRCPIEWERHYECSAACRKGGAVAHLDDMPRAQRNTKWCAADPGPFQFLKLERPRISIAAFRFAPCCAASGASKTIRRFLRAFSDGRRFAQAGRAQAVFDFTGRRERQPVGLGRAPAVARRTAPGTPCRSAHRRGGGGNSALLRS